MTLRRLWSLREDVAVETDEGGLRLLVPWGEIDLGAPPPTVEHELRRLALGPVVRENTADSTALDAVTDDLGGVLVHTLESPDRRIALTVVPVSLRATFRPVGLRPHDIVRLSRFAVIRPWAGVLVVSRPGADHEVECRGATTAALLYRLATGRQVSDLCGLGATREFEELEPGREEALSVEQLLSWLAGAGVLVVRRRDGRWAEDADEDLDHWSPHELEFDVRGRRPGQAEEQRFRFQTDRPVAPVTREPWPGPSTPLPARSGAGSPLDSVLSADYESPSFGGQPLTTSRLGDLLDRSARLRSHRVSTPEARAAGFESSQRPYLSMAWLYELELYVALEHSDLASGMFHYDPEGHGLTAIDVPVGAVHEAVTAVSSSITPQRARAAGVLLLTERRARSDWALGSATHATALAHAGALQQVLHLVGRESGFSVHPIAISAADGWHHLLDRVWPGEVPVGVCALDPIVNNR